MSLLIGPQELAFEHPRTREIRYTFMIPWMRRFGKQNNLVYFECGRKCPNGEGTVRCATESAKLIHSLLTTKSSSKGKTVIPHKPSEQEIESANDNQPLRAAAITAPSLALNASRKHPGLKLQTLVPITPKVSETEEDTRKQTPPVRKSVGKGSVKLEEIENTEKKPGPVSDIAKELENKLNVEDGKPGSFKTAGESRISKSKDDKKREKEEKKERERREKEEKKERERREKEEKKERERLEKEKKKSKKKEDHSPVPQLSVKRNNIYDEPEIVIENSLHKVNDEVLYDEAITEGATPMPAIIGEYAEAYQVKKVPARSSDNGMLVYDEAVTGNGGVRAPSQPAEYAQPVTKSGSVKSGVRNDMTAYTYVKPVEDNRWKSHCRTEEEEVFEEDYTNIKEARNEAKKQNNEAPPIPNRGYSEQDNYEEDDGDNTYNVLDLKHSINKDTYKPPENLYGEASARKVSLGDQVVPVRAGDDSDSEGEELEEDPYDHPQLEGYEDPQELRKSANQPVPDAYEEAQTVRNVPQPANNLQVQRKVLREPLYEEVK